MRKNNNKKKEEHRHNLLLRLLETMMTLKSVLIIFYVLLKSFKTKEIGFNKEVNNKNIAYLNCQDGFQDASLGLVIFII